MTSDRPKGMADEGIVLVADDSRAIRSWLRRQLSAQGYTVIEAAHGVEAVHVARTPGPTSCCSTSTCRR